MVVVVVVVQWRRMMELSHAVASLSWKFVRNGYVPSRVS